MAWRIASAVFVSIILIEAIILVPSYKNFERDLLTKQREAGFAAVKSGLQAISNLSAEPSETVLHAMYEGQRVVGLRIYDSSGAEHVGFGEIPTLSSSEASKMPNRERRSRDGDRLLVYWPASESGLDHDVAMNLDTGWISQELMAFLFRIAGLVILISVVVTTATLLIVGLLILNPVLKLRENLERAKKDTRSAASHSFVYTRDDELGDMVDMLNELLRVQSEHHHSVLQISDQRFRDFASAASDWFWEMDENLRFSYFSDRFFEVSGVEPSQLLGKTRQETGIPDVDPAAWHEHLENLRLRRPFRNFVHPRTKANGDVVQLSINGRPVYGPNGQFLGFRGTGSDITEAIEREQELRTAKEAAEKANQSKSDFLMNMSHELRTPLNAIIGFSDLMKNQILGPLGHDRYMEYASDINQAGFHLLGLINDILDIAKLESGGFEPFFEELVPDIFIQEVVQMLRVNAEEKDLTVNGPIGSTPVTLSADARAFRQMLLNLLANAIKFTGEGGEITITSDLRGNGDLAIKIEDNGIGVAQADIERIMEKFGQVDNVLARENQGTGLGLPLVRTMIESHGGHFEFESTLNVGTTATIVFPADHVSVKPQAKIGSLAD